MGSYLDANPLCFQAIVDYFNGMIISFEENPPDPTSADNEHTQILRHQLELFGLVPTNKMPKGNIIKDAEHVTHLLDSKIIKDAGHAIQLHD